MTRIGRYLPDLAPYRDYEPDDARLRREQHERFVGCMGIKWPIPITTCRRAALGGDQP